MLLPRNFNNGRVGIVSRIPDGSMTTQRVASRQFLLGEPEYNVPNIERVADPRVASDSPPEADFISYSPTLCPPPASTDDDGPPPTVPFETQMMMGVDHLRQFTFMPIQMSGYSAMAAIVARSEANLEQVVQKIKADTAERVRKLALRSSEVLFTKLKETVRELEKTMDEAYGSVEAAEKKADELCARAADDADPPAPADETPADDPAAAGTEINPEEGAPSHDASSKTGRSAKKKKADKDKDKPKAKPKPRPNPVVTAIFEAMDAAKGSGTLAQGQARALLCKRDDLSTSLRREFTEAMTKFRNERSAEMVSEDQTLQDAKANFRRVVQKGLFDAHLEGITPTSVMIQSSCLNLVVQIENRAQDRVTAAHDQAERLLDLVQHMFLEALPSLVFLKCSDIGTLDVSLRAFLALLQWVRELGALSFPLGGGTTPASRSKTGELLLPSEVVNAAIGRYMTPETTSAVFVETLRRRLPNDASWVGSLRSDLIKLIQPLTRELAANAVEKAQGTHAVACLRDLPTEDWVQIFKDLVGRGLPEDSTLPLLLSNIINSDKEAWVNVLSRTVGHASEPVSEVALGAVEATIPAVLQSELGMQSLCAALNNSDHHDKVVEALRTFTGSYADDFLRNTLSRPGGSDPIKELIADDVAKSVNKYVLDIAEATKAKAERRVIEEAKAWRDSFRKGIKDELIAELGVASSKDAATSQDADRRISELERSLSDKESSWKKDLSEKVLTQVREIMRLRSSGTAGVPGLPLMGTPPVPPRQPSATPGHKRSGHSPGEGVTPIRKKSRDEDVIELDADDGAPPTPVSGRTSSDVRHEAERGATPRGGPSAPRRKPTRVSATEHDLRIKSELYEPAGDDTFTDAAAGVDDLRDDHKQDEPLADEVPPGSKGDEDEGESEDHDEDDGAPDEPPEGAPVSRVWTTHDNWQSRLDSLNAAQKLDLDFEKEILTASGESPAGFDADEVLKIAALSRLGDNMSNRKFRAAWASRNEEGRAALADPLGFKGPQAIGFTWLASVHWSESRDPMILPIEVVDEDAYNHGRFSVHLPELKLFTPEHKEVLAKTMAACTWLQSKRRMSKLDVPQDSGRISEKEIVRDFVTLVYDTPPTKQGFDEITQNSQVLAPFFSPYVLRSFKVPGHKSTKYFCPFCRYVVGNGHSMNAHIRTHLSLAGVCGHCLQATMATQNTLFKNHWENECTSRPRASESTGKTGSGKKKASVKGRR